ncbi:hypothetical protein Dimus_036969, partial [Dionaea muscipula]
MQVAGAISDVLVALPFTGVYRSQESKLLHSNFSDTKPLLCGATQRRCQLLVEKLPWYLYPHAVFDSQRCPFRIPKLLRVGRLLERILHTHPHLLPATVDQQLENLQKIRDAENDEFTSSSQDLLLYNSDTSAAPAIGVCAVNAW